MVDVAAALAGAPSAGTWTLTAGDRNPEQTGTVTAWTLTLHRADQSGCGGVPTCRADLNGSGGTDVPDIFAFLSFWFAGC